MSEKKAEKRGGRTSAMGCGEKKPCAIKVVVSSHCRREICLSPQGFIWEWSGTSFVHAIFGRVLISSTSSWRAGAPSSTSSLSQSPSASHSASAQGPATHRTYDDRAYTPLVASSSVGASPAAGRIEPPKHRTVQENHTSIFQAVWECT